MPVGRNGNARSGCYSRNQWRHAAPGLGCGIAKGRLRGVRLFRLSLRLDACAIPVDCRTAHLQGALTETLGIALAGLRQHDDALARAVRMGSSQPGVAPSEASATSNPIPI
jgi:hypothetical protein